MSGRLVVFLPFGLAGVGVPLSAALAVSAVAVGGIAAVSYAAGKKKRRKQ